MKESLFKDLIDLDHRSIRRRKKPLFPRRLAVRIPKKKQMCDKKHGEHLNRVRNMEKTDKKEDMDAAFKKHLLRDRTFETLKAEVKKGLRKEGLEIEFASPGKNARTSSASK